MTRTHFHIYYYYFFMTFFFYSSEKENTFLHAWRERQVALMLAVICQEKKAIVSAGLLRSTSKHTCAPLGKQVNSIEWLTNLAYLLGPISPLALSNEFSVRDLSEN